MPIDRQLSHGGKPSQREDRPAAHHPLPGRAGGRLPGGHRTCYEALDQGMPGSLCSHSWTLGALRLALWFDLNRAEHRSSTSD
jgi:hypothetical protein